MSHSLWLGQSIWWNSRTSCRLDDGLGARAGGILPESNVDESCRDRVRWGSECSIATGTFDLTSNHEESLEGVRQGWEG